MQRGEGGFESENTDPYVLFDVDEYRKDRYEKSVKNARFILEKLLCIDVIEPFSGDWKVYHYADGLSNRLEKTNIIPQRIKSSGGLYTRKPKYEILRPHGQTARWQDVGKVVNGVKHGNIIFNFELGSSPIQYSSTEEIPNSISFNKEERHAALYSTINQQSDLRRNPDEERLYLQFSNQYPKNVIWEINYPLGYIPKNPRILVTDEDGNIDFNEQKYCRKNFHYSKERNSSILNLDYPIRHYEYSVVWDLESEKELIEKELTPLNLLNANKIKKYLLSLTPKDSNEGSVGEWLQQLHKELIQLKNLGFRERHKDIPLEISISTFDEDVQKIRYVAFFCPKCGDLVGSTIWNHMTAIGHPISGWAYKKKQSLITLAHDKVGSEFVDYLRASKLC